MAHAPVLLKPVTAENWQACAGLELRPDQTGLVPDNLYSIAEAQFYPDAQSLAVYLPSGALVSYVLYGRDAAAGNPKVFRLMIDRAHQGRGHGRAALQAVIKRVKNQGNARVLLITYQDRNQAAKRLYASLEFTEQEVDKTGKVTVALSLPT